MGNKNLLKTIGENLKKAMENSEKPLSVKELAELSDISYTSLITILKGERDFGVSKLIELSDALQISPNAILKTLYQNDADQPPKIRKNQPKYYACFLTTNKLTRCRLHNELGEKIQDTFFPFSLYCTESPEEIIATIKSSIKQYTSQNLNFKDVGVYISVLSYEHIHRRKQLKEYGSKEFGVFIAEPDWHTAHKAFFKNKNGIMITINDGYVISFSVNEGESIHKHQGYSVPISDEAGSIWIGSEAIKHAINVQEGIEKQTLLSDKILSLVNSDIDLLATEIYQKPRETYLHASKLVQELARGENKPAQIIHNSFKNIWKRISAIDKQYGELMQICLSGDLAYLYEPFIPKERLLTHNQTDLTKSFEYSLSLLKNLINDS